MEPGRPAQPAGSIPVFAPLSEQSRTGEVVRQLTESIELGLLPAGFRLPPESELAEQLGVSAMTLREALATLREQGLVVTRRGRGGGSFVESIEGRERGRGSGMESALRAYSVEDLRDLLDHHDAIGAAAAKLAAERAGASELARLAANVARLDGAPTVVEQRQADAAFHIELAAAAHSTRLTREEVRFQGEISGLLWLLPRRAPSLEAAVAEHTAILAALEGRDPFAARLTLESHLQTVDAWILASRLALQ
jgi:GntR family transcriptional repressor for pyruvate dehydrogenase complex